MFSQMLNVIAPILIISLIGYGFGRSKFNLHVETLGTTVILVAMPSLIFTTLTSFHVEPSVLLEASLAALIGVGVSTILALVVLKLTGLSARTFLPSIMFPNAGNMGLPLALLAFGEEGLRLAVAYFVVVALLQHSVGMSIAAGTYKIRALLRQPLIYSVICVIVVAAFDIQVPQFILSTTEILGGMMIPAMLILLGNSLAVLKISDLGPALIVAVARLVIGVIAALIAIWILGLTGVAAGTVFFMTTMPTAVVNYIYAQRFRPDSEKVAGAVLMSTLLSFACLPALLWAAVAISNL
jgi:predicted permease